MKTRIPATLLTLALCSAAFFSPAALADTLDHDFAGYRVATADELDEMRGGFDLNAGGLHLSFSIERVTFINGVLAATTRLNIPALNSLGAPQTIADSANPQTIQAITAGLQNTVGAIQNGPRNTLILPDGISLSTSALTTVIQNTLDNQVIRNMTILNATLSNQALARATAISSALDRALIRSVR
jgi:hypothetical protein